MGEVAIRVENLGKRYRISAPNARYKTLRESLSDPVKGLFRRGRRRTRTDSNSESEDVIWALKDVSFEVKHGDVLGIIGRNGAGKSTLLKILSRITEPTEGLVEIEGRVGSLLEVGTGFHGELTGRENIYLNGAILGMKKAEIDRKFDEIVSFAEMERFIDTPVKHYSSGMYLRLAFAVAAHLEPEVLLVDEVLAVGDAVFQKRCIGKMEDVAKEGRTVLFVSHNLAAIRHLCSTAVMLSAGKLHLWGHVREVAAHYEAEILAGQTGQFPPGVLYETKDDSAKTDFAITRLEMLDEHGRAKHSVATWDYVGFRIHYYAPHSVSEASAELSLASLEGASLLRCSTQPDSHIRMGIRPGMGTVDCIFSQWPFAAGRYLLDVALALPMKAYLCRLKEPAVLDVQARDVFSSGQMTPDASRAFLAIPHRWRI